MSPLSTTDVLIVGAGPMGLLTSIGLAKQGVDTIVLDKRERNVQVAAGRATTLYPRSLELLEPLGVTGDLLQKGFVARSSVNFKNGNRVNERGWNDMFDAAKLSYHDYLLNIRQCNSEEVFLSHYEKCGKSVWYGWKLVAYSIDTSLNDGFHITATLEHPTKGQSHVRSKYLLGADGGASSVRQLSGITMDFQSTSYEWIRIDGKISTDMPGECLGFASIETEHHGNVLWVKLDGDAHRIGYALTPHLLAKYPNGITETEAVQEAIDSVKPFKLHVDRLDWWTHYKIRQGVTQLFRKDKYVLLGGDAAHIHSSGFAQGMNTGIHDATNLVWKLAGAVKGWYKDSVLDTYHTERHAAATRLISIDTEASSVISGNIPARYESQGLTADEILWKTWTENISFNVGLGVSYAKSVLNQNPRDTCLQTGKRCPDALIRGPGINVPLRLYDALLQDGTPGRWSIVVFAGNTALTKNGFQTVRDCLESVTDSHKDLIRLATIMAGSAGSAWSALGGPALGNCYFDGDGSAHAQYGIDLAAGAIVVIRPDTILSFATGLSDASSIADYFSQFLN
ncbi:related to 2-polyprenyl-6-methoxyphenol hydroxylase and related FAD-dependent oxidoreductases [Fusarium proliferatum ET1]|uniref:Related to 2-polyprenyl-6-methoxyphenol hydroxylase and related FAD-dependent oxidoreductases n=1 Tax=Fusarium proliferatum (strain ET1) TaxID=1227346 RepID=A0A1L7VTV1_FUSPR|nr:related to 2-polyprenyl-6-methoxyphenol hydroxylase and related FAD-dependent oxidoreductases [Fusarium proliferatum ET1]CZR43832.1 related to 2-polyprenyl-6-methoxyphenol hydroxylase and related FAD-dependent oxidoreductases [Fusarium proliferatum ET1]